LTFACGTGDDFHCFDWSEINVDAGKFVVLHSVINSETGSFIQDGDYQILPANTEQEKKDVLRAAFFMLDQAYEWLHEAGDPLPDYGDSEDGEDEPSGHDEEGWNQSPYFFLADIAASLFGMTFKHKRRPSTEEIDAMREVAHGA
jgi:hypothetical protein